MFPIIGMCGNSAIPISIGITNNTKGITAKMIPRYKQFFAFLGSSSLITKYAITPPITLKKIGSKNQKLLLLLTCIHVSTALFHLNQDSVKNFQSAYPVFYIFNRACRGWINL